MTTVTCTNLFEDEIADVFRAHPLQDTFIFIDQYMFSPACMICDDESYTSGDGYFTEYVSGYCTGNHITTTNLIQALAHRTFTIKAREAKQNA